MGIGSTAGIESMSSRPMGGTQQVDSVSKNIQKELSEVQRQKQQLSSKEDLPVAEKVKKRQELQQKISGLNRELKQRETEANKKQQREALVNESRNGTSGTKPKDDKAEKTKDAAARNASVKNPWENQADEKSTQRTDSQNPNVDKAGVSTKKADDKASQDKDLPDKASQLQDIEIPQKDLKAVAKSNISREQMRKQETVIARIEGGIAILKSEIKLDKARGADVTKKQAELEKQEEKLQKASASQFSTPDQFNQADEKTAPAKIGENTNFSKEKETAEQQPLFQDITVSLMS